MAYTTILFDVADGVATITLNRPDEVNTITLEFGKEINDAANRCANDPEIRAVILTANGKLFSGGGDLGEFAGQGEKLPNYLTDTTTFLHTAFSRFCRMDPPMVTAVNGTVAGGSLGLALAGDIVIAAESAKFTLAYTLAGLSADGGSTYILPRLVGLRKAQQLMLLNPRLTAEQARDAGLITEVVPSAQLMPRAQEVAGQLAAGPTLAHGTVKRLLADSFNNTMETQMEFESRGIIQTSMSNDGREGIDAFLHKRKPSFTGS